jgi:hypothetical protein
MRDFGSKNPILVKVPLSKHARFPIASNRNKRLDEQNRPEIFLPVFDHISANCRGWDRSEGSIQVVRYRLFLPENIALLSYRVVHKSLPHPFPIGKKRSLRREKTKRESGIFSNPQDKKVEN